MELNEMHSDHEHATTSLKVLLLVFAIVLVGALAYLVWAQNTAPDTTDNSAATTKKTTAADEAAGWKTYTDSVAKLTFQYPPTYSIENTGGTPACTADTAVYCGVDLNSKTKTGIQNMIRYREDIQSEFTSYYDSTNPPVTTLEGYLKTLASLNDTVLTSQKVAIDTHSGYWITDPTTQDRTIIYVEVSRTLYFFSFDSAATYDKLSVEQKQIIASIKFTS